MIRDNRRDVRLSEGGAEQVTFIGLSDHPTRYGRAQVRLAWSTVEAFQLERYSLPWPSIGSDGREVAGVITSATNNIIKLSLNRLSIDL
jgi:hypothetical protein